MRALFAGEVVDHDGLVRVDRAKLWTLPAEPPPLLATAVSVETAGWAGEWADGLITINQPRDHLRAMLDAFDGPAALQLHCRGHRRRRRRSGSPTTSGAPTSSRRRCAGTSPPSSSSTRRPGTSGRRTCAARCWSPPISAQHAEWIDEYAELGFDPIYLHHVGRSSARSSRPSASTSSRACEAQGHQRPVVEERGRLLRRRRDVPRLRRRRLRRPRRPDRAHRLPRGHRRVVPVADAVLSVAAARRRLRHHRLLRDRRAARDGGRLRRADPHGERPRDPRDRRPRRQPHLRSAPVVPGRPRPRVAVPRLLRVGRGEARGEAGRRRVPGPGEVQLGVGPRRRSSGTCTASTRTSPTSTSPTRSSATRSPRSSATGSSRAWPASGSTPCRS